MTYDVKIPILNALHDGTDPKQKKGLFFTQIEAVTTLIVLIALFLGLLGYPSSAFAAHWQLRSDGQYAWSGGHIQVMVDPFKGGRITALQLRQGETWGDNILLPATIEPETYGSTFWLSPQSTWNWPPDATIDRLPYTAIVMGDTLTLKSGISPDVGIQVSKEIRPQAAGVCLTYQLAASEREPPHYAQGEYAHLEYAPWEVSRVPGSGLTIFSIGSGIFPISGFELPPILQLPMPETVSLQGSDIAVWDHQAPSVTVAPPRDQKLFADGRGGWLAHVDRGMVFIKRFLDLSPERIAPGEAEIEVYATASRRYLELEVQGAYEALTPERPHIWRVQWQVRSLPPEILPIATNPAFLNWVRQVAEDPSALTPPCQTLDPPHLPSLAQ